MKKLLFILVMFPFLVSCKGNNQDTQLKEDIKVETITLNKTELSLKEDEEELLTYVISPDNATNKEVKWSSSSPDVASVTEGKVKAKKEGNTQIEVSTLDDTVKAYCHVTVTKEIITPPIGEEYDSISYNLGNLIGKKEQATFTYLTDEGFNFEFNKETGQNNPKSTKDNGGYVALYTNNTLKISGKVMKKIEFEFATSKLPNITSSVETLNKESDYKYTWTGSTEEIVIAAISQSRLQNITIYYKDNSHDEPSPSGIVTLNEVKEIASRIVYTPNSDGWYLSSTSVTVNVEALDAIDSTATSGGLSSEARGKVLVVDSSDYIICSSGVSTNNPISFYQRVKDYLKAGTTQYRVTGNIAFFNGVVEINVTEYQYDSTLVIEKNYDKYISSTIDDQTSYLSGIETIKSNPKGYGVGNIIRFNGLTYFNKYNSAGSYLFIDKNGDIIPVFSCLDKDRSLLTLNKSYDIIGLETLYLGRPSLRIIKVMNSDTLPTKYDFINKVTEIDELTSFYSLNQSSEQYKLSELKMYHVEGYVSSYAADKYTFNTSYYTSNVDNSFTTGTSQVDAANHNSLGIFNENLDYKQTFTSIILNYCDTKSDCQKVDLYFTLARLDTVNSKNMWRVNVLEDLVFGLDYYNNGNYEMVFDVNNGNISCNYETGSYQTWTSGEFTVTNSSTKLVNVERKTEYLKINSGTDLVISSTYKISGVILYHSTFSSLYSFNEISEVIRGYKIYSDHVELILTTPSNRLTLSSLTVSGEDYLRVSKMNIKYSEI